MPLRAIVRPPGQTYPDALTRREPRPPVDLALAREQHAGYVTALRQCGVKVLELPPDDARPDAVFVQDRVHAVDGRAIVGPSAVESRRGEAAAIVAVIGRFFPVVELAPPARLDWGDVLVTEDSLFVGLSERSNEAAVAALRALLGGRRRVEGIRLPAELLHLLSGCSYLGGGVLLAADALRSAPAFRRFWIIPAAAHEPPAANVLSLDRKVLMASGSPETASRLEREGFEVYTVAVSEFEKRDGGVTCLSILF